jgi:F-type H+-transporting ATPase subunit delta
VSGYQAAARVYAKALFDLALQEKALGSVSDDLHAVQEAVAGLDPELRAFFYSPRLRPADKWRILDLTFEGKVSRPVLGLLHVLVQKRREPLFDDIVKEFDHDWDDYEGRVRATVITARKLDADLAKALREVLEQRTRKTVVLKQWIDPEAIGGIRVNLGDFVLDGTIRRALSDMRRSLVAPYERG